ncbi:MAG: S9 family peptidase [Pseudomonadota bacterium]
MNPVLIQTVLTGAVLCAASTLAAAATEAGDPPRFGHEQVFALEYAADPQISPDGKTVIYARRTMDRYADRPVGALWEIDVDSGAQQPLLQDEVVNSGPRFAPDGKRLVYLGQANGKPTLRVLYRDTGRSVSLGQFDRAPSAPSWSPDGRSIAFAMFVPATAPSFAKAPTPPKGATWSKPVRVFDDLQFRFDGRGYLEKGSSQIFVVPADGGSPRQLTEGAGNFGQPVWLNDDTLLVTGNTDPDRELDPIESEIYRLSVADGELSPFVERDGPDYSPQVSPDGRQVAYAGYDDKRKAYQQSDLYVVGAAGGEPRNLTADYDRSVGAFRWRADGRALIAMVETDGDMSLVLFPLRGKPTVLSDRAGGLSLGRPYGAAAFSVASKAGGSRPLIAFTLASPDRPAEVGLLRGSAAPKPLTALNEDALAHIALASIEELSIPSRKDGRAVEAWVALPPDFKADGSFPMVLEIHGGPFAMYGPYFAAEIQRYAAEGYVTVYVNPRGSTGYGEAFAQLIDLAYPGDDYEDLMSVVDELVKRRYVAEDRLFITGGSGGGILTAWTVTQTDRFAAAASIKPVINWTTMALAGDIARVVTRHWMRAMPWENRERYWNLSPISKAGNVVTPTLMMVGEEDWRTPTWEAEQFYMALKQQKVDTALIRIPGASHSIAARPSRLIAKVDNIIGWFRKYDPALQKEDDPATDQPAP